MLSRFLLPALVGSMLYCGGCISRAVKEGLGAVSGPKGIAVVLEPVSSQKRDVALEDYSRFTIQPFTDDFGGHAPAAVNKRLPSYFEAALRKDKIYQGAGGKTLLIRGRIISFEDSTRATSQVFGPFEELIARVELVDQGSGKVIGVANCIGRSTETVNQGLDKKIEGLADAIASWIDQHYPKPVEKE